MQTDVKEAFAIPRFTGERFDAHTLPVEWRATWPLTRN